MRPIPHENIGNLREDYKHKPRKVKSQGLVTTPSLVLKLYSMVKDMYPTTRTLDDARNFLEKEIEEKNIDPLIGLGFAILSEDMLNIARWDTESPIVVKNQIYSYEGGINSAEPLDIREVGPFCIWELGIVNHERNAWKRYLISNRTEDDKKRYLDSVIEHEGELGFR